nr:hypothetical protein GCM10020093_054790 [Planobispora longispora]
MPYTKTATAAIDGATSNSPGSHLRIRVTDVLSPASFPDVRLPGSPTFRRTARALPGAGRTRRTGGRRSPAGGH